ncbi:MAG TPA: SDR family NAD(P)-dependent oxidoreductase, partial [Porticoccus sp.]|nr:SDR family NAD(P)-dependent oxidoreductase [Porticoccus sp.]
MMKSVLVTGSSRGIGKAIALHLSQQGFEIVLHCRSQYQAAEEVLAIIKAAGGCGRVLQFDIANRQQTATVLNADIEEHGVYYGVVCNAGISADNAFPALSEDDWDSVIPVSYTHL